MLCSNFSSFFVVRGLGNLGSGCSLYGGAMHDGACYYDQVVRFAVIVIYIFGVGAWGH